MYEYIVPDFLKDNDEDAIHERMLDILPNDIDKSEASYAWDFTRPTAIEHARLKGFHMNEAVKLIWPMFATGIYLDYHGEVRKLPRKKGISASGKLLITGKEGTNIYEGDLFSTEKVNGVASVFYKSMALYTIPESKTIEIEVSCLEVGLIGNAPPNTVILKGTENDGIQSVTNPENITGGIERENDDDYRDRIVLYDRSHGDSYTGNIADYTRWANEVNGVGGVKVIPANDDTGLVTIIITDGNGNPATPELCQNVYNHIMRPDSPIERYAPINAYLNVISPETLDVTITATIEVKKSTIDSIKELLHVELLEYFKQAMSEGEIRYTHVAGILSRIEGVYDFKTLTINGESGNLAIPTDYIPVIDIENIILTEGEVI